MKMFEIRKAEAGDVDLIKELEIENGLESWSREDYLCEIDRKDSLFLTINLKKELIGFIIARLITNSDKSSNETEAEICNLAIKKKHQRQQLATNLIKNLLTDTENLIKKIYLEVRENNLPAINFYKKNNFKTIGIRKNFYRNPTENAILMAFEQNETKVL